MHDCIIWQCSHHGGEYQMPSFGSAAKSTLAEWRHHHDDGHRHSIRRLQTILPGSMQLALPYTLLMAHLQ